MAASQLIDFSLIALELIQRADSAPTPKRAGQEQREPQPVKRARAECDAQNHRNHSDDRPRGAIGPGQTLEQPAERSGDESPNRRNHEMGPRLLESSPSAILRVGLAENSALWKLYDDHRASATA